jgi:hypothetical protein
VRRRRWVLELAIYMAGATVGLYLAALAAGASAVVVG